MLQLQVLLQKLPQVGIVKGFSKDVEIEILHVKKSLAEHPVAEDRWLSRLSESIAPGDSISEAGRKKRAEAGDKERNNGTFELSRFDYHDRDVPVFGRPSLMLS